MLVFREGTIQKPILKVDFDPVPVQVPRSCAHSSCQSCWMEVFALSKKRCVGQSRVVHLDIPHMGVSKNNVTPKSSILIDLIDFNRVFHYKPSILGYPYFWKHPSGSIHPL